MNAIDLPIVVAGLVGALSPVVLEFLNLRVKSPRKRWLVALALSGATGVFGAVIVADGQFADWWKFALTAWGMSQAAWNTWRKVKRATS